MKNLLLAVVAVFIGLSSHSQDEPATDTTATTETETTKRPHQDMLLVDFNWDHLLGLPSSVKQEWFGRGIGVATMYDYPFNKNGNVSLGFGVGFTSHNYYTNALVMKIDSVDQSGFFAVPDSVKSKGKLSVNYVDVPLELRFRTNENEKGHRWKMAVGGKVGYLIDAHEKTIDSEDIKIKTYNYPHISQIRYGVSARVGYGSVMLYGFYSLSTFFETGKSLGDQNALSIGITILPF